MGRRRSCVGGMHRQLIIRRRPQERDRWTADLSLSHAPDRQQKGSLDLSEQEAPTHLLGSYADRGGLGQPHLHSLFPGTLPWLSDHTQPSASSSLSRPLFLPCASTVAQQQQQQRQKRKWREKSFLQYHHSGRLPTYRARVKTRSDQTRPSSPLVGTATLAVEGTRPFPLGTPCYIVHGKDDTRLPTATRGRAGLGSAGPTPGISCLCAGSPTTALPLVRGFPPRHRTTAPVRQVPSRQTAVPRGVDCLPPGTPRNTRNTKVPG